MNNQIFVWVLVMMFCVQLLACDQVSSETERTENTEKAADKNAETQVDSTDVPLKVTSGNSSQKKSNTASTSIKDKFTYAIPECSDKHSDVMCLARTEPSTLGQIAKRTDFEWFKKINKLPVGVTKETVAPAYRMYVVKYKLAYKRKHNIK